MESKPVSYLQTDPRWKNKLYAAKGESSTIGGSGCGPTAMAMVLATWADPKVTPETECAWAQAHGYKALHSGTYYFYFVPAARRYGLECRQLNSASIYGNANSQIHDVARAAVSAGDLVIACMGPGTWTRSGHYVLVWKISGNIIFINDPASTRPARTAGTYALFRSQVKYYWTIKAPAKKEAAMSNLEIQDLINSTVKTQIERAIPDIARIVLSMMPQPVVYNTIEEIPAWGREAVEKRLASIQGTGEGLGISVELLRTWVIQDREEAAQRYGMD